MRNQPILTRRAIASVVPFAMSVSTAALAAPAASLPRSQSEAASDPIFAQIELHKALRDRANSAPGRDDDPAYVTACVDEEAALQSLGDILPVSIAGAVAQLRYMAEVEGCFADPGSPLLRTVLSVAAGLGKIGGLDA